jgi:RNA polymerase sigma factor (sigma-70 family)
MITCKGCDNNLSKNGAFSKCGLTGRAYSQNANCENSAQTIGQAEVPVIASEQRSDLANGAVADVNKILLDAIKDFTDKEKIVFSLRYIKGMTLEEIGKICNCTVGDSLNMIEKTLNKLTKATASL